MIHFAPIKCVELSAHNEWPKRDDDDQLLATQEYTMPRSNETFGTTVTILHNHKVASAYAHTTVHACI